MLHTHFANLGGAVTVNSLTGASSAEQPAAFCLRGSFRDSRRTVMVSGCAAA
jgi:hypothetical protein